MKWECTYYHVHTHNMQCVMVGTLPFHGTIILYRCKYIGRREIKLLIDSHRDILKVSSILGLFWSKTAKIDHFDQNDPKIELISKFWIRRSIRNLILRTFMYLHR